MIDYAIGKTWLVIVDQCNTIFAGNVLGGNDDKLLPIDSGVEADLFDPAAGNAAANCRAEEHVRQLHIIDIARLTGDFVAPLHARNGSTDDASSGHAIFQVTQRFCADVALAIVYVTQSNRGEDGSGATVEIHVQ